MAPVGGPVVPTEDQIEGKLDQVLKMLGCHDPVVNKRPYPSSSKRNDRLLDMTKMDEEWFAARNKLRKAIAEMMYADECSWW